MAAAASVAVPQRGSCGSLPSVATMITHPTLATTSAAAAAASLAYHAAASDAVALPDLLLDIVSGLVPRAGYPAFHPSDLALEWRAHVELGVIPWLAGDAGSCTAASTGNPSGAGFAGGPCWAGAAFGGGALDGSAVALSLPPQRRRQVSIFDAAGPTALAAGSAYQHFRRRSSLCEYQRTVRIVGGDTSAAGFTAADTTDARAVGDRSQAARWMQASDRDGLHASERPANGVTRPPTRNAGAAALQGTDRESQTTTGGLLIRSGKSFQQVNLHVPGMIASTSEEQTTPPLELAHPHGSRGAGQARGMSRSSSGSSASPILMPAPGGRLPALAVPLHSEATERRVSDGAAVVGGSLGCDTATHAPSTSADSTASLARTVIVHNTLVAATPGLRAALSASGELSAGSPRLSHGLIAADAAGGGVPASPLHGGGMTTGLARLPSMPQLQAMRQRGDAVVKLPKRPAGSATSVTDAADHGASASSTIHHATSLHSVLHPQLAVPAGRSRAGAPAAAGPASAVSGGAAAGTLVSAQSARGRKHSGPAVPSERAPASPWLRAASMWQARLWPHCLMTLVAVVVIACALESTLEAASQGDFHDRPVTLLHVLPTGYRDPSNPGNWTTQASAVKMTLLASELAGGSNLSARRGFLVAGAALLLAEALASLILLLLLQHHSRRQRIAVTPEAKAASLATQKAPSAAQLDSPEAAASTQATPLCLSSAVLFGVFAASLAVIVVPAAPLRFALSWVLLLRCLPLAVIVWHRRGTALQQKRHLHAWNVPQRPKGSRLTPSSLAAGGAAAGWDCCSCSVRGANTRPRGAGGANRKLRRNSDAPDAVAAATQKPAKTAASRKPQLQLQAASNTVHAAAGAIAASDPAAKSTRSRSTRAAARSTRAAAGQLQRSPSQPPAPSRHATDESQGSSTAIQVLSPSKDRVYNRKTPSAAISAGLRSFSDHHQDLQGAVTDHDDSGHDADTPPRPQRPAGQAATAAAVAVRANPTAIVPSSHQAYVEQEPAPLLRSSEVAAQPASLDNGTVCKDNKDAELASNTWTHHGHASGPTVQQPPPSALRLMLHQLPVQLHRAGVQRLREGRTTFTFLLLLLALGLVVGWLFGPGSGLDSIPLKLLLSELIIALIAGATGMQSFQRGRGLFYHEIAGGGSAAAYFLGKDATLLPLCLLQPLCFLLGYAFLASSTASWLQLFAVLAAVQYASSGLGLLAVAAVPSQGAVALVCAMMASALVNGFNPSLRYMSQDLHLGDAGRDALTCWSVFRWSSEALLLAEADGELEP